MTTSKRFDIEPLSGKSRFWLWTLCFGLPLLVVVISVSVGYATTESTQLRLLADSKGMTLLFALLMTLAICLPLALILQRSGDRATAELDDSALTLRVAWYRQRIAISDLDLAAARIVDLAERSEWRPLIRTNGIGLPGFHAGHFRLRSLRQRAFCVLTSTRRVLALPERGGRLLLLSLRQPQALLDALGQGSRAAR
ncbi:MAG: hypothetical protein WCZ65_06875 [Lysobacteraceae bacterium]|jgi:uncharacterized membrane protein YhaH (DUF805 family)